MSEFKRDFNTGIFTVEGNLAGSRAAALVKEREKQQEEYDKKVRELKNSGTSKGLLNNFTSDSNKIIEKSFQDKTIGLVTAEEFRKAKEDELKAKMLSQKEERERLLKEEQEKEQKNNEEKEKKRKKISSTLSFNDEDEEEEEIIIPKKKLIKDPTIDTSFLPDKEREREIEEQKEKLKAEWLEEQEKIKKQVIEVTYSYWDGTGHRKVIRVPKGTTIGKFTEKVKEDLMKEFSELRAVNSDDLLYIKEDLIIPHYLSFYDLIITKARGKSGPLFHFDVHEDIRLLSDATVEKMESHPGKIVERKWYERNKHIFPASRWEIYDPSNPSKYTNYTIKGNN